MNLLISIIIPCYKQAPYLSEALQSVLDQTYTNWECIIVNDGSPDDTAEIAQEWLKKDERFRYIYKENGGLSSARNAGLDLAIGEYIQFLDADDLLNKFKFEKQLACFIDNIDIVICDYFPFDSETGSFTKKRYMNPFPDDIQFKNEIITKWENGLSIPCHSILFKALLLKQNNDFIKFEESLLNHEDWVFWVKVFYYSSGIFNLKYSLASYRIHMESMCAEPIAMKEGFLIACRSNLFFFESLNEKIFINLCNKKFEYLLEKKTFSFKKTIYLFIPPIVFRVIKIIKNYYNEQN